MIEVVPIDATLTCGTCGAVVYRPHSGRWCATPADLSPCQHCIHVLHRDLVGWDAPWIHEDPVLGRRFLRYRPDLLSYDLLGEDLPLPREPLRRLRDAVEDRANAVYRIDFRTHHWDIVARGAELRVSGGCRDSWAWALTPHRLPASRWVNRSMGHSVLCAKSHDYLVLLRDDGKLLQMDWSDWPAGFYHHKYLSPGRVWASMLVGGEPGGVGVMLRKAADARVLIERHQPSVEREHWQIPPEHIELLILLVDEADSALLAHYEAMGELMGLPTLLVEAQDFVSDLRGGMEEIGVDYDLVRSMRSEVPSFTVDGVWESNCCRAWSWRLNP